MRKLAILCIFLFLAVLTGGCADDSGGAPSTDAAHSAGWLADHANQASASAGYADCRVCHGAELKGSGKAVNCYECHSFNSAPPFSLHPTAWSDATNEHRAFAAQNGNKACLACHGAGLRGSDLAPSCFSESFNGQSCHAAGPGLVPHPLDGSFLDPANHGPVAKADLTLCQSCHGEAGGAGSNPRFDVGIFSAGGQGCESCHGEHYAHPDDWTTTGGPRHVTAENIQQACTLCHGKNLDGVGAVGVSCLTCHTSTSSFTLPHPMDGSFVDPANHGAAAKADLKACQSCHGEAGDPGSNPRFDVGILGFGGQGCESCHGQNYAHPADWAFGGGPRHATAGNIQQACTLCHGKNLDGVGGDGVSCLRCHTSVTDFSLPHPMDGSFLDPANHGPAATADLTFCQRCHGQPGGPGSNPRFNIGITDINQTGLVANPGHGCEGCHQPGYAHPSDWTGPEAGTFHYSAGNVEAACTLCHGAALDGVGGVGVDCLHCHADANTLALNCTACHGYPPEGETAVTSTGVDHSVYGGAPDFHQQCKFCHGMQRSADMIHFDASSNYLLFDRETGSIGDHWNGKINLDSSLQPIFNDRSVGCTACHANDPVHRMGRSGLPVILNDYGN